MIRAQARKRVPGPLGLAPADLGPGAKPLSSPGPLGKNDAAEAQAFGETALSQPFEIHLELSELVELNEVLQHSKSELIARGKGFARDPQRPQKVLSLVQGLFSPLGDGVRIRLGSAQPSHRFLKAAFAWGGDPDVGGVSAQGITRSRLGKFNRMGADQGQPVTGYIFEGVIGNWIVEYLGGTATDINSLFAVIIAHELGHQLGLGHTNSPADMLFAFGEGSRQERIKWLEQAQKRALKFSRPQVATMQVLLSKP